MLRRTLKLFVTKELPALVFTGLVVAAFVYNADAIKA